MKTKNNLLLYHSKICVEEREWKQVSAKKGWIKQALSIDITTSINQRNLSFINPSWKPLWNGTKNTILREKLFEKLIDNDHDKDGN